MTRTAIALAAAFATLVLAAETAAAPTATKLTGTVGPGFTISLKKGSAKVTKLPAGAYTITVADKSNIHNFRIVGPGLSKQITTVPFVGTKSATVTLKKGRYQYVCDPHAAVMRGIVVVS